MTWLEYSDALHEVPADSEVIVGTGAQATWRVRRADLMPKHFVVVTSSNGAQIRPFSSDAVVSLNGRQLPSGTSTLGDGDVIAAGSGQFRFWADTPSESRSVLPVNAPAVAHLVDGSTQPAVSLNRITTGIGQDESNALVMADVSTFEAEIRREAGGHALHVSSTSTVRVNGKPVTTPLLLSEGDEIQIGGRVLRYTRRPLADVAERSESIASTASLELTPREPDGEPYSELAAQPAMVLRNPMRAVAFVSSVIAAVAIATLVLLHRGP